MSAGARQAGNKAICFHGLKSLLTRGDDPEAAARTKDFP
jgi:hypothetical protein